MFNFVSFNSIYFLVSLNYGKLKDKAKPEKKTIRQNEKKKKCNKKENQTILKIL